MGAADAADYGWYYFYLRCYGVADFLIGYDCARCVAHFIASRVGDSPLGRRLDARFRITLVGHIRWDIADAINDDADA